MKSRYFIIIGLVLLALSLGLAACTGQTEPAPAPPEEVVCPEPEPCPEAVCPEAEACPEPVVADVPYEEQWVASPHADAASEAFVHWDGDDPAQVPESCAKCHSTPGFLDFLGVDGSVFGEVNLPAAIGSTIECAACHNDSSASMTSVIFPSGIELTGLGSEARCMQCHQGRSSKAHVDTAIENAGLTAADDTISADLSFINIHYYAAAATQFGTQVKGGYEYEGMTYDARFDHVDGYSTCDDCHDAHTLEVKVEECSVCHANVAGLEDIQNIRMESSLQDYDGDGDISQGIQVELAGLQGKLLQAMQAYAVEVAGVPIGYDSHTHPYFFIDGDESGMIEEGEANRDNQYKSFTPRLLKAAYNYQVSVKDPGGFAHGGKYLIQLLYDSITDLNTAISTPVDMANAQRNDPGHFAASSEAFRHWDEEGLVPGGCAKCHTADGLPQFLYEASQASDGVSGVNVATHPSSGFNCATCHSDLTTFELFPVNNVRFPGGAVLSFGEGENSNLCINCHQGREANATVQTAIQRSGAGPDAVSETLNFRNPHYFAAGATLFGGEAAGAYQYPGKTYAGRFTHIEAFDTCIECHDAHSLEIRTDFCGMCHPGADSAEEAKTIRSPIQTQDYDGDGNVEEGIGEEIEALHKALWEAIKAYAIETEGVNAILYDGHAYPYFFIDTDEDGRIDAEETTFANRYVTWTPRLLGAAYNYTWVSKDPGSYAHNGTYMIQVLYDSLQDLGADVGNLIRP
jgi:hypothetical protein